MKKSDTTNLVIVESPAKAKTIQKYLGKDFIVKSSFGHIRDLAKSDLSIDITDNFKPTYIIDPEKKKIIEDLKKESERADYVWLASDEDREGEAIAWHLSEALKLDKKKRKRIVFHEITKNAILEAVENPRDIDFSLVNAQQARRVLDRLVGYELSPILWKKIKANLSAGRVQSVAVRLIAEREKEIHQFQSQDFFKVTATFISSNNQLFKAELDKKFNTENEANVFLEKCKSAIFKIESIETKPSKKSPSAPFTTSTLQQEASRKLGFSVAQTMTLAQRLYEAGLITYMRTDSVNLSDFALKESKEAIEKNYGKEYYQTRQFKTKSKNAQEAHEAIRPTNIHQFNIEGERNEQRLYELIWKRTVASQMADAQLEKTVVKISVNNTSEKFTAQGEVIKFDGFLKLYIESTDDENENNENDSLLPPLKQEEILTYKQISAQQKFSHHPPRYTEASLVKKLEELGIGRPSTYAPTISTVQKRDYVVKMDRDGKQRELSILTLENNHIEKSAKTETTGAEKSKLFPTDLGIVVNDFLIQYFPEIMDYQFTAGVEEEFDEISRGELEWEKMIGKFYFPFHKTVVQTIEVSERSSGERFLGIDPKSGKKVIARIGRYGPLVQIGETSEDEKPQFAKMPNKYSIHTINLEEALSLFQLPRVVGSYNSKDVVANIGRFGPYVLHNGVFCSIPKDLDPHTINLEQCITLIDAKKAAVQSKTIQNFENENIQILNGRFGPYISYNKKNYKIPKDKTPSALTLQEVIDLIGKDYGATEEPVKKSAAKKTKTLVTATTEKQPKKKAASSVTKKVAVKKASKK